MEDPGEARDGQDRYELVIPVPAGQTPAEAVNLGVQLRRWGETGAAKAAYQRAIDSGDQDVVPVAAFNLGVLLRDLGDTEGAKAAYHRAIGSGHAEAAPLAALNLAFLLEDLGNTRGA